MLPFQAATRNLSCSSVEAPPPPPLQGSETVIFPCERWLAKSEDDGETVRELVPSDVIAEKLLRDGNLRVTEVEVEDALESTLRNSTFMQCRCCVLPSPLHLPEHQFANWRQFSLNESLL